MAPTSPFLLALLLIGAAGSIGYAIFRLRRWWTRVTAAALGVLLAMTSGVAIVNDFYGYYQTWSALRARFPRRCARPGADGTRASLDDRGRYRSGAAG